VIDERETGDGWRGKVINKKKSYFNIFFITAPPRQTFSDKTSSVRPQICFTITVLAIKVESRDEEDIYIYI
jgi:hypothetical protein